MSLSGVQAVPAAAFVVPAWQVVPLHLSPVLQASPSSQAWVVPEHVVQFAVVLQIVVGLVYALMTHCASRLAAAPTAVLVVQVPHVPLEQVARPPQYLVAGQL